MRIVENTQTRLVLAKSPWVMALLVAVMGVVPGWAAIFWDPADGAWQRWATGAVAIGVLWLAWWAFPFTRTVFDRPGDLVVHEERRLTGARVMPVALSDIRGAQVRSHRDETGGRSTRLVLLTAAGELPLEKGFGQGDRRALESAINDWLTRPPT